MFWVVNVWGGECLGGERLTIVFFLFAVMVNVTWLSGVVKSHNLKEVVNVTFWQRGSESLILHRG